MKTLTRKSLDELAETMPVLSEREQQMVVGGYNYYDQDGRFLGSHGSEPYMRMVDSTTYNMLVADHDYEALGLVSSGISNAGDSSKINMVTSIASGMGLTVHFFDGPSNQYGESRTETGIWININSPSFESGNMYDFMLTLRHENLHGSQNQNVPIEKREYEAYKAAINDSDFEQASPSYQQHVRNKLAEYAAMIK